MPKIKKYNPGKGHGPKNPKRSRNKIIDDSQVLGEDKLNEYRASRTQDSIAELLQEQTILLEQILDMLEEIRDKK